EPPRAVHERPRGRDALLVMRGGVVLLSSEGRGKRLSIAPEIAEGDVTEAARALVRALHEGVTPRDLVLETIDGRPAVTSRHAAALALAGFRATPGGLRYYATLR
ncbi:MAG: hypothetical protein HOQ09_00325, partial [Gemmatimonadaceae bacterium]|nr:hypothetical protein [Gemmatimonadaceae bacterium]